MRHVVVERWSRGDSFLHRRDARVKLIAALAYILSLGTYYPLPPLAALSYALPVLATIAASRLPLNPLLGRSLTVLPFTATFALLSWLAGDGERAFALVTKSYLSAFIVLLLVATTSMPALLHGAERLGAPKIFVLVIQFLYRYLFVIAEQARNMWTAAACRGSQLPTAERRNRLQAASGMLAVLFVRSYERAERIERAMLARGFNGSLHPLANERMSWLDLSFVAAAVVSVTLLRLWRIQ